MKNRVGLYLPFGGFVVLLGLYTGYWFYAKSRIQSELAAWMDSQVAAGYSIEQDLVRVSGFPYRFAVEINALAIDAPAADGDWSAEIETITAHAMPFNLAHWIIQFDGTSRLNTVSDTNCTYEWVSDKTLLSIRANRRGVTQSVGAEIENLSITTIEGEQAQLESIERVVFNAMLDDDDHMRARMSLSGMTAEETRLDPRMIQAFGTRIDTVDLDIAVSAWSALAQQGDVLDWHRSNGSIRIENASLGWGPAQLSGTGDLAVDARALPEGRISVRITDPEALAEALVNGGIVAEGNPEEALRLATMMAPRSPEGVSLPLRIQAGAVYFGPVRLGTLVDEEAR